MKRYALLVDVANCSQCHACVLACKDEHYGNDFPPYTAAIKELGQNWITMRIDERGSGSKVRSICQPELCRHCAEPQCVASAGAAVTRRDDGIVLINPSRVKGNRALVAACPYNAISWNDETEQPQKCTLCAHLLDAGETTPRCVEACPNGTISFGDLNDPGSEVSRLVGLHPELAEQNSVVRYYNIPGRFAVGSVYTSEADVAEGALVELLEEGVPIAHTQTNGFGDFRIEDIPDKASIAHTQTNGFGDFRIEDIPENERKRYSIRITLEGYNPCLLDVSPAGDTCWEEILLQR